MPPRRRSAVAGRLRVAAGARVVSALGASFFRWVQGADFYIDLHREAVDLALATTATPAPTWIDVGCGPGLVARLAADRGSLATGIDRDPAMIRAARRHPGTARFASGTADALAAGSADVVSAASLLYGASDPRSMVATLWAAVAPGGALLIVETTSLMTVDRARARAQEVGPRRRQALTLWARARGGTAFDRTALDFIPSELRTTSPLLHGLVEAIIVAKPRAAEPNASDLRARRDRQSGDEAGERRGVQGIGAPRVGGISFGGRQRWSEQPSTSSDRSSTLLQGDDGRVP